MIKASRIFVAVRKRLIDSEKYRSPSWLFDCHRGRAHNIKKVAAFAKLFGRPKRAHFSVELLISLSHSSIFLEVSFHVRARNKNFLFSLK